MPLILGRMVDLNNQLFDSFPLGAVGGLASTQRWHIQFEEPITARETHYVIFLGLTPHKFAQPKTWR